MKKRIGIALLLIITLLLSLLAFVGCSDDGGENGEKQVPVYQGMSITSAKTAKIPSYNAAPEPNPPPTLVEGDFEGRNDTIDEENPYPENGATENIEEEIKSSLNVIDSPDTIYYATPNEDIYINIHIDNPDSFEIMSFTLNGKKYSSYMFEKGSDMETIILKYNVGSDAGIVEYTIDAIKYIDGTEIKDVVIDGNKTVMAGIRTENQVAASVTGVDIDTNALSFNVNIKDNHALIAFSKGSLKAVIYDGFNIVAEKDLALGDNAVTFEGLKTNTLYQYAVVGYYDDLSGSGFGMNVLYKDAFYTDSVVLFDDITVGQETISFGYLWHEDHQGKAITSLKLYKGNMFVRDIATTEVSVSGLLSNTTYKLVAEYSNADKTESIYIEFTTFPKAVPEISLHTPTKTQTLVGFTITETDTDNVGAITKIELVHANGTVAATALDQRSFEDLLSNNVYTVKVTYVYDLNDGKGAHTVVKELAITTLAKAIPDFTIMNTAKEQESLSFSVSVTDADSVGAITKVELIHGTEVTTLANAIAHEITALLSNNDYTLRVTYTYNLNDGVGAQTLVKELTVKTEAKTAPSFAIKNEDVTTNSIHAEYNVTDVDHILVSYKVELYKGATLVLENAEKAISFASLAYYTDYTLKITYTYDLNDGAGVQTAVFEKAYKTLPYIDVVECNIANTSAVSEGETIFMSVKLENPLGMTIESVVINGVTYGVTGASTKNKIFVEIVYNGQFAGGDTHLKVDTVNARIDGTALSVAPASELSDNVFINGKLEVLKIELVNEDFEPVDWVFPSERVYVLITLDNPTGYTVDSVNTSITGLTRIDDDHWYYATTLSYGWNIRSLDSIGYHNEYITKVLTYSGIEAGCYRVASDEVHYISTPDDLKNADDGYYYELSRDIDLAGLEWIGTVFDGVLDGKGYAIKNLSFVGTVKNSYAYLGLFGSGRGVIQNLHIKEATIIADVTSDDGSNYSAYCGALVAWASSRLHIHGCTVDEYTVTSVKNTSYGTWAGGLVGYADSSSVTITNSTNSGSVSATSEGSSAYAGGLVGHADYFSSVTITNSANSGNISATGESSAYAGGLVGDADYNFFVTITNSTNSGSVSATSEGSSAEAGGLVGSGSVTITNSTNSGNISATGEISAYAGGFVGYGTATITNSTNSGSVTGSYAGGLVGGTGYSSTVVMITNSYSLVSENGRYNGEPCTAEQLNTKAFYTETLGWSEDVWDFSDLDVENGKCPMLKA